MLDYKDIITKHYALGMSGRKIAESLKVSKSGVNDFLRAFQECPVLSYPLPEGITNYGIAALVYRKRTVEHSRDLSYEMPDYETVEKEMSSRKNMTLVVLWNRYSKQCRDRGVKFYSTLTGSSARTTPSGARRTRRPFTSMPSLARRWRWTSPERPSRW